MRVGSRSRSKGEIANRKQQGVLRDCKQHEQDARSGGSGVPRLRGHWWTVRWVWCRMHMWNGERWCEMEWGVSVGCITTLWTVLGVVREYRIVFSVCIVNTESIPGAAAVCQNGRLERLVPCAAGPCLSV